FAWSGDRLLSARPCCLCPVGRTAAHHPTPPIAGPKMDGGYGAILLKKSAFSRFRLNRCNNDSIIHQNFNQLIADKPTHERIFLTNFACRVLQQYRAFFSLHSSSE